MKLILFGAGDLGNKFITTYDGDDEIIAIADNYFEKSFLKDYKVIKPNEIVNFEYDCELFA